MQTEGLTGPLGDGVDAGTAAHADSASAPASPTEEELAAAKAWHAANVPSDSDDD